MTDRHTLALLLLALAMSLGLSGQAVAVNWDGGGTTDNWSDDGVSGNWSGLTKPGTTDAATFTDADGAGGTGIVTNIVDTGFTIAKLSYELAATPANFFHTTQINGTSTLLATGGMGVAPSSNPAGPTYASNTVDVAITGPNATLQVGNTGENTANMVVAKSPTIASADVVGILDLSGLGTFVANLNRLDMGAGIDWGNRPTGTLILAPDSTIDANEIRMGYLCGAGKLYLGQAAAINVNTLRVGMGKGGSSNVEFQAGLPATPTPTLALAGLGGGAADLYVSYNLCNTSGATTDGMDLSGGVFNATLDELILGYYPHSLSGGCRGTLIMDDGTVTANSVQLAISPNGTNKANTTGTLTMNSGSFTVNGNVTDGDGTSTLELDGGDFVVHGDFAVDSLRVGRDHTATSLGGVASLTVDSGGVVRIGPSANLDIGVRAASYTVGDPTTYGTVDLSGAASATIDATTVRLGTTGANAASGVLILSPSNTITATTITIGDNPSTGNGGLDNRITLGTANTVNVNTLYVGRRKSDGVLNFATGLTNAELTLRGADGASRVSFLGIGINDTNTGSSDTSYMDLSGGRVDALVDTMTIGHHVRSSGTTGKGDGFLILSDDPGNAFDVNAITLGTISGAGSPTANGTIQMGGGTFAVHGNVTDGGSGSELQIDGGSFTVEGDLTVDKLRAGYNGRTATVTVLGDATIGASGNLYLGLRDDAFYGPMSIGTLDLSGATSASLTLDSLQLGISNATGAKGILLLSPANTIHATTILMGDNGAGGSIGIQSQITFGAANEVHADTFTIGARKSEAMVDIVPDGTLTLSGETGADTDLRIGYNSVSTASTTIGTLDLSGGTFDATLNDVVIGLHSNLGGAGQGSLTMDAGTVTANSVVLAKPSAAGTSDYPQNTQGTLTMRGGDFTVNGDVLDGGGTSTLNVDGGTMTINGDLKVDTLRVGRLDGLGGGTATLTVNGGDVEIGASGDLDIGRRTIDGGSNFVGTLDLTNAASVQLDLDNLQLGLARTDIGGNPGGQVKATGHLLLSAAGTNTINAGAILLGDVPSGSGSMDVTSTITFGGAANTVNTDSFTIGGRKGFGAISILPGGTLNLTGLTDPNDEADLFLGHNNVGTNSHSSGTLDMRGGTLNATLDQVVIGRSPNASTNGRGIGKLYMDAGAVTANGVTMAETVATNAYLTTALLQLDGGSFTVDGDIVGGRGESTLAVGGGDLTVSGDISVKAITLSSGIITATSVSEHADGTALTWTGGTLQVGTVGFTLVQNGGILAPGTSPGYAEILGDYNLNAGSLEIEINDDADQGDLLPDPPPDDDNIGFDYVNVLGTASLDSTLEVVLLDGYLPPSGTAFDVLGATEIIIGSNFALGQGGASLPRGDHFAWTICREGNREFLRLQVVPEPGTLALLGLALPVLLRRRRHAARG